MREVIEILVWGLGKFKIAHCFSCFRPLGIFLRRFSVLLDKFRPSDRFKIVGGIDLQRSNRPRLPEQAASTLTGQKFYQNRAGRVARPQTSNPRKKIQQ